MNVGIVSYGAYIPKYRIRVEEIAKVWGANANSIIDGLMVFEKSVPDLDEDTITIAVEAARHAINRAGINPEKIGAIYTGSESHPYAVKPSSTVVAEAIGATPDITVADIIGKKDQVANIESTYSYTTDTPDFWRREGMPYPEHGGRFTGEPGYFKHVSSAAEGLLKKIGTKPSDYNYAIFHQPNGKFPTRVAKMLGFSSEQIKPGLVVPRLGNTYSGSCMMCLAATLDIAKAGDRIFMTSFGSGAGSDAFSFMVTDRIEEIRNGAPSVEKLLADPIYINYATYARHKNKIKL